MRYFLLSSCIFFLLGCSGVYKGMQNSSGSFYDVQKFKPVFNSVIYKTDVNVIGKYLSGLLIIKKMPDSSTRIVFSNEMGLTFFDFGFASDGSFTVFSIIQKMNKKPVIKTLKKDFELLLMQHLNENNFSVLKKENTLYYKFPQTRGFNYYILDSAKNKLIRAENASKHKTIVKVIMNNCFNGIPDSINISHTMFKFTIGLKRIENNVSE